MSIADPNKTILTGENPFIRLSHKDGDPNSTERQLLADHLSPAGPGHVLYLKSELTENRWRIYSDNIAMARWLQSTVQGMLNAELSDTTIPCADARVLQSRRSALLLDRTRHGARRGDLADLVRHRRAAADPHRSRTPIPDRRYGVCTVLIPALGARLSATASRPRGEPGRGNARAGRSARRRWRSRKAGPKRFETKP